MKKQEIIAEIIRTARSNGNVPLGQVRFRHETGIGEPDWNKYWARWGDALIEAGFKPNEWTVGYDEEFLIQKMILLIQELKKFPTRRELKLKSVNDPDFPSETTFRNRLGKKHEIAKRILEYCQSKNRYLNIQEICYPFSIPPESDDLGQEDHSDIQFGYVYLMKSGRYYTIGKSDHTGRRSYEHGRKLPQKINIIHAIKTDDPLGVEAYWHNRFKEKRTETDGSWYELNASDVRNFKKWKRIF